VTFMRKLSLCRIAAFILAALPLRGLSIDTHDTRMLAQPAVSADHIAFIYAEDLWVANADGSQPRRLTVSEGVESNPVFSPDGKTIAFSAQYDGNVDVYTIPVEGGIPKRLTWHPGADIVRGFTPDGKSVLFISQRANFTNRYYKLFTVPLTGGPEKELPILTRWQSSGVHSYTGCFSAMEALPGRHYSAYLAVLLYRSECRDDPAAGGGVQ
jgi:tricorn protease